MDDFSPRDYEGSNESAEEIADKHGMDSGEVYVRMASDDLLECAYCGTWTDRDEACEKSIGDVCNDCARVVTLP